MAATVLRRFPRSARVAAVVLGLLALYGALALVLLSPSQDDDSDGSGDGGRGIAGVRLQIVTSDPGALRRGSIKARVHARQSADLAMRAHLSVAGGPTPGVGATKTERTRVRAGTSAVTLPLTPDARVLAGSCVTLRVTVVAAEVAGRGRADVGAEVPADSGRCAGQSGLPGADARFTAARTEAVDPGQQTEFGQRSHWLQPWKSYQETLPATRLREALGINFNVRGREAAATARLLAGAGFRRARVEISWNSISYDSPNRFVDEAELRQKLTALKAAGIRPLILLNSNHGLPAPNRALKIRALQAAPQGARSVRLAPESAADVVPRKTGFDDLTPDVPRSPDVIITGVSGGVARLARPLPRPLPAGEHDATTLRYAPFGLPRLADGRRNPAFEETMTGWLRYVATTTRFVRGIYGSDAFDVEVWNELSFGSDFLFAERYYDPAPRGEGEVPRELLERTIAWLREPDHGVSGVGITDGFGSQTPFAAGSTAPRGLTAISKHPYRGLVRFPEDAEIDGIEPLDAAGRPDWTGDREHRRDRFIPRYRALLPEFFLTAIKTENLIRDLSPRTTQVGRTSHGRRTSPPGGSPPEVWMTEMAVDPSGAELADPRAPGRSRPLSGARLARMQANATLRTLTAFVNKGVSKIDFYAAKGAPLGLVSPSFYEEIARGGSAASGGPTIDALRRLRSILEGARRVERPRELRLAEVSDTAGLKQFEGDGSSRRPALYDRDVLAFLPFQLRDREWAVPVYVMTRDLTAERQPQPYRLKISGDLGRRPRVALYDPLTGTFAPARVTAGREGVTTVDLLVGDSPRVLLLQASR